ncbi:DHA2 family methylenomycin A resistance protein-like MFS transporter [Kribbella aluminosa]|uniref:DHA2 family methylenomycin A resistance protein-like MFS transporter n=1 Tax=Kribbella aluminosa TaxID=416017 RepID=A0ABS4UZN1_9ACTN|nr:MFS transporter [Kribbella aluminosa]MBP2357103.1 DHA2 family methylenomycin A resistance protein-like MFS transporter [Kribbella aluminosa]
MSVPRSALLPAALSFFLVTLNASMTTTALPSIGRDLPGGGLPWVLTGYSLVFAICLLPAGAWADRVGATRAFVVGVGVFAVTSVVCAVAGSLDVLLVARALQGAAAAVVLPAGLSMVNSAVPDPAARARAVGRWAAAGAVALVVGSPLGGAITSGLGWRATFWLNVPVGLLVLAIGHRVSSTPAPTSLSGVAALVRSAPVVVSSVTGFALNFASYGAIFVVTLLLQQELGRSAWETGLVFVPMTLLIIPANLLAGRLGIVAALRLGQALMAVGLLGLCFSGTAIWQLTGWLLPIGAGAGLVAPSATTLMLNGVPPERGGLGSGLLNAARQLGSGAAPAIFGALLGGAHFITGYRISVLIALAVIAVPLAARPRALVA